MTTDKHRGELLRRAVTATAESDADALGDIFTDDVSVWSPGMSISSRTELAAELRARDEVFGDLSVAFEAIDVVGNHGYAEWVATAIQKAALVVDDEVVIDVTEAPLTLRGVTVARFVGDRIAELRQYWDEVELLEGLGLLPAE